MADKTIPSTDKLISDLDQIGGVLTNVAELLVSFHKTLVAGGFSQEMADRMAWSYYDRYILKPFTV